MDVHALEILEEVKSWDFPVTSSIEKKGAHGGKYQAISLQLLSCLIKESQALGGTLLDEFWEQVGTCHPKIKGNIENLTSAPPSQSSAILFAGVDRKDIDLNPIFDMAAEYFTHLAVAFMNPGGAKSGGSSPCSVGDIVSMKTDELLALAAEEGFGEREREALKILAFKRDGARCVVTGVKFNELPTDDDFYSALARIIPNSVHGEPGLKCLTMFAGEEARDLALQHMNGPGNVMNLQLEAHLLYGNFRWGIEARKECQKVKYIYRRVPYSPKAGPAMNVLRDGDEIHFGCGKEAERHGRGPVPLLCNVRLAVARALHMSGAAEVIMKLKEDADDSDFPHVYIASDYFCDILDSKLLLRSIHL